MDGIYNAIRANNDQEVKRLVQSGIPDASSDLLHSASQWGNPEIVKILLDAGMKQHIDTFDELSLTPLMWAALNNHISVVKLLLSYGANVNVFDEPKIGNTAVREAARNGTIEIIKALLDAGADPRIKGWMQLNAIDVAEERHAEEKSEESEAILKLLKSAVE